MCNPVFSIFRVGRGSCTRHEAHGRRARPLLLPEYIWLATGAKSQFNDRLMVLKGCKVTAFPDIDGYDEWRKKAKNYPMLDITISDILERNVTPEQRERQVDIADVLLEEMLKRK